MAAGLTHLFRAQIHVGRSQERPNGARACADRCPGVDGDISFDMGRYDHPTESFSDCLHAMIAQTDPVLQNMQRYEQTLKYVELPPLDRMPEPQYMYKRNAHLPAGPEEAFKLLHWLYTKKGVRKIIRLVVPDRLVNPHDERLMAYYVRLFQVEVLDWRVLDLSIAIFKDRLSDLLDPDSRKDPVPPACLEELSLYSSGKRSAIYHWFDEKRGLMCLRKVAPPPSLFI